MVKVNYLTKLLLSIIPILSTTQHNNQCLYDDFEPSETIINHDNLVNYNNMYIGWTEIHDHDKVSFDVQIPSEICNSWFTIGFTNSYNVLNNSEVYFVHGNDNCETFINSSTLIQKNNQLFFENSTKNRSLDQPEINVVNKTMIIKFNRSLSSLNSEFNITNMIVAYGSNTSSITVSQNSEQINAQTTDFNFFDIFLKQQQLDDKNIKTNISYLNFSLIFFFTFLTGLVVTHSNKITFRFINRNINVPFYGYMPMGSLLFISFYICWWSALFIYSFLVNNISEILLRLGLWISLNLSIILLPITRNSIWVIMFDLSRERVIYLHKIISIFCLISVIIKFIVVLIYFPPSFLIKVINDQTGGSPLAGTYSTFSIILCCILGLPFIRKNYFEVFFYSHKILSTLAIIFGILHYFVTLYYVLPPLILYIIDIIVRVYHTHYSIYSKIQNFGEEKYKTSCTFLNVTCRKSIKTYPGCYFFVCIYKDISRFQWHPLTLVSNKNDSLLFCIKNFNESSWSGRLRKCVDNEHKGNNTDMLVNKKVKIQGPYGGHITNIYKKDKYINIMLISGGIGITPMISISKDIDELNIQKKLLNLSVVNFIWIIPHESMIYPFKKMLEELDHDLFNIKIYVTKPTDKSLLRLGNFDIFKIGRPDIAIIIKDTIISNDKEKNLVLSCGPLTMTDTIKEVCIEEEIDISSEIFE
jgi:NAD(P)H-flavin reductase